jgi:catechol 2,3-dioxygenase-like lactoylglutathione lyase family enzyme
VLESSALVAFVAATDLHRANRFYAEALGLRFVAQNQFACIFDGNGTMLRISAVSEVMPANYTVLGWRVTDIEETIVALTANGVTFAQYDGVDQAANGVWITPDGDKVAWFADPDGNTLSLTQFS